MDRAEDEKAAAGDRESSVKDGGVRMSVHVLEAQNIKMYFGGVHAVDGISVYVDPNEILGVIGPNGSGKTTLINVLTGIYTPTEGKCFFEGADITGRKLQDMTGLGIARTFQNLRIFKALSVMENVLVGQHLTIKSSPVANLFHTKAWKRSEEQGRERALDALRMVGLEKNVDDFAGSIPYGAQKRLELARALVMEPKLLMLDEPTAGLNGVESENLMMLVKDIQQKNGISIILIEHNMKLMMKLSDRVLVMDAGREIALGVPEEVQANPVVIKAYLGEG